MTRAVVFTATFMAVTPALAAEAPDSGFEIGARIGYAFAAGQLGALPGGTSNDLGDSVSAQVPLWLDAGYRLNHQLYLGAYFSYGFGVVNDDGLEGCRDANVDCSASDVRLGVMGRYHFAPIAQASPWLGLGVGYEWGTFSVSLAQPVAGITGTESSWSGFEFANLQAGADFKIASRVLLAPFVSVSIGQFQSNSATIMTTMASTTMDQDVANKALHEWILIGLRFAFTP